jgi:hypothetical protein
LAILALLQQVGIEWAALVAAHAALIKAADATGGLPRVDTIQSVIGLDRLEAVLVGRLRAAGFVGVLDTTRVSPMTDDVVEQVVALIEQHVRAQSAHARHAEV